MDYGPLYSHLSPAEQQRIHRIKPLGDSRYSGPWIGAVMTPSNSWLGVITLEEGTDHFVTVRCLDACRVPGLVAGEDYLVRTDFVRELVSTPNGRRGAQRTR